MSRDFGKIERAIERILVTEADNAFTVEDLAERIYSTDHVEETLRVSILRAAARLMKAARHHFALALLKPWARVPSTSIVTT